jgi:predicted nucleotidyltransferase
MATTGIRQERTQYSEERLAELRRHISGISELGALEGLSIFCAGSYARLEASDQSDIDLFFVYGKDAVPAADRRTKEIKLFASLIDIAGDMTFPAFSNDAQYLATMESSAMLEHLGGREDDGQNHFTMRMLMLLESFCLHGEDSFRSVQESIISAYFRDYPDHQASFEPWFLINDIGRFWKTLLLNYEHKRNQPANDEILKNKQKVKNFKLKFSRMTTCFATVAALTSHPSPLREADILELVKLTPQQRLTAAGTYMPAVGKSVDRVLAEYEWFLEQTAQTEEELRHGFEKTESRLERFERANAYGDAMFDLMVAIGDQKEDGSKRLLRYLVI